MWDNTPVKITATEALEAAGGGSRAKARDEAKDLLLSRLALGPVKAKDIEAEAKANCISTATLKRAKRELKIKAWMEKGKSAGDWYWEMPSSRGED